MTFAVVCVLLMASAIGLGLVGWVIVDACRRIDSMTEESPPTTSLDDGLQRWADNGVCDDD